MYNNKKNLSYDDTKELLNVARGVIAESNVNNALKKRALIFENDKKEPKKDYVAITNDPKFGNNVLQTQIDAFKASVNHGAKFANENSEDESSNPLVYLPKTGNLVFSGTIPNLNNMKFQFSLMDVTSSPYIWVDSLPLTDEVVKTMNKLKAFYLNWREQWLLREDLLTKLDKSR